jgi:hypothetical protein
MDIVACFVETIGRTWFEAGAGAGAMGGSIIFRSSDSRLLEIALIAKRHPIIRTITTIEIITAELIIL